MTRACRVPATTTDGASTAPLEAIVVVVDQVAPAFVEKRTLTFPVESATHETAIVCPDTATEASAVLPKLAASVVDPTVTVDHVLPESLLVATLTDPVTLSVYATVTIAPYMAIVGWSIRPVVDVRR